ncbi:MAG: hypothetical protein WKF85_02550 [Chitinophagaceae bacterium]
MSLIKNLLIGVLILSAAACKKDNTPDDTSPTVKIVSPVAGAKVTKGEGKIGAGSFNGSGFMIDVQVITNDSSNVVTKEGLNIRNTALLGSPNPNMPTLNVTFDCDLIKPDGGVIAKNTNLAALFNIAGTDDTPGAGVTIWTAWHVLESIPDGISQFTITVSVTDKAGKTGTDKIILNVASGTGIATSGQALTPLAVVGLNTTGADDPNGPVVTMFAPALPTSVSTGPSASPAPPVSGALFFVQVSALDKTRAGIGVNENGEGKPDAMRGTIVDPTQSSVGPNRFVPGLNVTFDVPLLQPNGNVIVAGGNLTPVFNIAGSEIDPSGFVRSTFGWTVGGSLIMPAGKTFVTIKARVTDNAGKTGSTTSVVQISPVVNGAALTPDF